MKIERAPIPSVTSSGVKEQKNFTLKASPEAFRLLSSGMYSDPILAIVRELSCNAWDSHVINGNPESSFDIELPTNLSPNFRIRDYGTSLDHEEIMNLYVTYFDSTKTEDNNTVGALGIGSKSPLGYTQSFSVTAYKDGVMRSYSVFIGDDDSEAPGFPNIAFNGEGATDAANGIEITIPVPAEDTYKWTEACEKVFRWFTTKPTFVGTAVTVQENVVEREVGSVSIFSFTSGGGWNNIPWHIVQGNIAYPLDFKLLDDKYDFLTEMSGFITVDIGDVVMSPNREMLTYNKKTIESIERKLEEFIVEMSKDMLADLAALERYPEVYNFSYSIMSTWMKKDAAVKAAVKKKLDESVQWFNDWQDHKLDEFHPFSSFFESYYISQIPYQYGFLRKVFNRVLSTLDLETKGWFTLDRSWRSSNGQYTLRTTSNSKAPDVYKDFAIFYNDTGKTALSRFKNYLRVGEFGEDVDFEKTMIIYINEYEDEANIQKLKDFIELRFGEGKVHKLSDITLPTPKKRNAETGEKITTCGVLYNMGDKATWDGGKNLDTLIEDDETTYFWVEVKGFSPQEYEGDLKDYLMRLPSMFDIKTVVGVRGDAVAEVKELENWIHVNDITEDYIKPQLEKDGDLELNLDRFHYDSVIGDLENLVERFANNEDVTELVECPDFKEIIDFYTNLPTLNNLNRVRNLMQWLESNQIELEMPENKLAIHVQAVYNKTIGLDLLVNGLSYWPSDDELLSFVEYLNHFVNLQGEKK